jgi:hypothetical protein
MRVFADPFPVRTQHYRFPDGTYATVRWHPYGFSYLCDPDFCATCGAPVSDASADAVADAECVAAIPADAPIRTIPRRSWAHFPNCSRTGDVK